MSSTGRAIALGAVFLSAPGLLLGCSGNGGEVSAGSTTTSTRPPTTTSTSPCRVPGADIDAKTRTGPSTVSLLTDVRTGRQPCADRVVFDFREGMPPGYTVEYRSGPFSFGESGQPVEIAGRAFLVLTLRSASGVDLGEPSVPETYTGPASISPSGLTHVEEVRRLSDFEAMMVWVIGLDEVRPFAVDVLEGPPRVYVDIA